MTDQNAYLATKMLLYSLMMSLSAHHVPKHKSSILILTAALILVVVKPIFIPLTSSFKEGPSISGAATTIIIKQPTPSSRIVPLPRPTLTDTLAKLVLLNSLISTWSIKDASNVKKELPMSHPCTNA